MEDNLRNKLMNRIDDDVDGLVGVALDPHGTFFVDQWDSSLLSGRTLSNRIIQRFCF